jgi:hypothetical protein
MAWQKMLVMLGGEAPITVQTNAKDWAAVVIDPNQPKALDMTFRAAHHALRRTGASNVPRDYETFLELLDAIPETVDAEDADLLDPTNPAASDG